MVLTKIQNYLAAQGKASLAQMELYFGIDADALRGMLQPLLRKGRVRKLPIPQCCHGCVSCRREALEFYEWLNAEPTVVAINPERCSTKI